MTGNKPIRIFLVDDEPHVRLYLHAILDDLPVDIVAEAATGQEAVLGYDMMQPELVLMDISMPQMTGIEALRQILARHPQARIVLLTSIADQRSIKEALALGATDYIRKDTPVAEIRQTLATLLAKIAEERHA